MKKVACLCLTILFLATQQLLGTSALAYYAQKTKPGQRKLSYLIMPDQYSSDLSSSLFFHQGVDEKLTFELSLTGYRSWYLVTPYTYQIGLHGNQKLFDAGGLKFTGIAGLGGLYAGSLGASLSLDFGLLSSVGDSFSVLVLPSIFSDGVLLVYGAGFSFNLPFLSSQELTIGGRGNLSLVSSEGRFGFGNRLYGVVGVRTPI